MTVKGRLTSNKHVYTQTKEHGTD